MSTILQLAPGQRLPGDLLHELGWPSCDASSAVVLFVRGPWCPVCRRQIARFAACADEFHALGAPIYIISAGAINAFASDDRLGGPPMRYLNDPAGDHINALGIAASHPDHGLIARPAIAIIDPAGVIRFAHVGEHARDRPEPAAVLLAVRRMLSLT